jgi:hypothetical protein
MGTAVGGARAWGGSTAASPGRYMSWGTWSHGTSTRGEPQRSHAGPGSENRPHHLHAIWPLGLLTG